MYCMSSYTQNIFKWEETVQGSSAWFLYVHLHSHLVNIFPQCILVPKVQNDCIVSVSIEQVESQPFGVGASHPDVILAAHDHN